MEKQAPLVDLCIYVQKYWKGTRTLSACKSASPHSELLQMKSILLTPLAFIQVTSSARPLLSHKFRVTQLMANPFLRGCQGCQGRSCAQSSPFAALLRDIPWPACSGDPGEGTQPCPILPASRGDIHSWGTGGLSKLLLLLPAFPLASGISSIILSTD